MRFAALKTACEEPETCHAVSVAGVRVAKDPTIICLRLKHGQLAAKVKDKVLAIYEAKNPAKVAEIDTLMTNFHGKEVAMYRKICKKYGVPVETFKMMATEDYEVVEIDGGSLEEKMAQLAKLADQNKRYKQWVKM